jgi:hypothetical protein
MNFKRETYINEMKTMVDKAVEKIINEKISFEIYTMSIWTDPNASISSICLDSKINSDEKIKQSNEWNKKYYDQYIAEGDLKQAKLFEPLTRNCNPADFHLCEFVEIKNKSIPTNWEDKTGGNCWEDLEPVLKEIGEYAFKKTQELNIHSEFQLSVNGRQDWYEFIWNND